jgi:hypothetical protein
MIDPRSCCFCDMDQATEERIPACTRPPTKKIRGTVFGHPALMDVCDHHYDRMPEDAKPNKFVGPIISGMAAESDAGRQEMMKYLSQEKVVEFSCKGCGAILVREHEQDGALGLIMKGFGIDLLVVRKHLDECDFRRTTA